MTRGQVRFLGFCVAVLIAATWPGAFGATTAVTLRSRMFVDRVVSINAGDTVMWTHRDGGRNHTVTASTDSRANGVSFDSHPNCPGGFLASCMERNDTFRFAFASSGTFTYFCKVHGRDAPFPDCGMCGQVRVSAAPSPTPSNAPPTTITKTSPSPSASPTVSPSDTLSASPTGGTAAGPPGDDGTPAGAVAIAGVAVVLLAGSGFVVYRTLIKRSA